MNKHHIKGKVRSIKGKINEEVGHATGSESREGKGIAQQIVGKLERGFGNAKDSLKRKVDDALAGH